MAAQSESRIPELVSTRFDTILEDWIREQLSATSLRRDLLPEAELKRQSQEFLRQFGEAIRSGRLDDIQGQEWAEVRNLLGSISRSRAQQGFSPGETAMFVLSFKQPLFVAIKSAMSDRPEAVADEVWRATVLLDRLGLFTTEVYQRSREEVIQRQQQELLELSTPVVKLWDGVVAVPLIGTLDSERTQVVMENLLQRIVEIGARIAIVDITGVPTVDTLVAQHLIKTVQAARLMGAECIISGIRPQIAQTIVHLGVMLGDVTTKASLADAFAVALHQTGFSVVRSAAAR